jgi:hypothetical protein
MPPRRLGRAVLLGSITVPSRVGRRAPGAVFFTG